MNWSVDFTKQSEKFLKANNLAKEEIFEAIRKTVRKFEGENNNIDLKKLKGEWAGFYRIRIGKLRIIAEFDFDNQSVFVEAVDWRGNIYK